jgi:hypothetical protein
MSKPAATPAETCHTHTGRLGIALSVLTLMSTGSFAAAPESSLRSSEQIDTSRIGKLSGNERAVLRVEWRAAATGADEARSVQAMLDSLRRMEGTIGEVRHLISNIPAQHQIAVTEPSDPEDNNARIVAASIVATLLAAFWSFRRRSSSELPEAVPAAGKPTAASPPPGATPVAAPPARVSGTKEDETTKAPSAKTPLGEPSAVKADGSPPPNPKPLAAPAHTEHTPSVEPPAADSHVIDFKLEDAEPEAIERENARLQKLQALDRRKDPERHKEPIIDPTLELAEIMLSLGLEEGAAQTLVDYTESNPREALHHWLKLLDIYRKSGNQQEFKEATEKLRRNFNIQAEEWARAHAAEAPSLESFSRLSEHIQQTWSRPEECSAYLRHLLADNRDGSRAGFPQAVAEEILLLIDVLKELSRDDQTAGT